MIVVAREAADAVGRRERGVAFVAIFERHFDAIHRYLRRRVGRDLADDLAAETFARAYAGLAQFDPRSDARPWLFGIAANVLRRHYRDEERKLRAYARTGVDPAIAAELVPVERLDATGPRLAAALADLPPVERDALLLYAWGELDYAEIAQALAVPVGTVRSRLHRARARIRAALGARTEGEDA